ncbi:putative tRNA-splicing endonuclease subunit tsp-5 [Cladobotryum mycophilum]|uniref:tRNA-splicing endonuclease subunit tsp-5 n=1 Tax=Cladobotryum mycophilum TaxID=491253 RepID=A0ABR0T0M3_9HYPO
MPFDDDDDPLSVGAVPTQDGDGAPAEEALEDDMPDYKLFMAMFEKKGVSSKTIRKGEKDFEAHGTMTQENTLETSRKALEDVLSYTRIHKQDSWARGWYFPDFWTEEENVANDYEGMRLDDRVVVLEHEKGSWMKDIGRVASGNKDQLGVGRLWLLPEEALYLIERGTLDLWWPSMEFGELLPKSTTTGGQPRDGFGPDDYEPGLPLSLEAAYSLLIGFEGERGKTTLPKYQVYTHLKRAGFNILRAPLEAPKSEVAPTSQSLWQWLFSYINWETQPKQKPFGPLVAPGLYRAYRPIYAQLALLPRHKPLSLPPAQPPATTPQEPFKVHYHVWKPAGGSPKVAPSAGLPHRGDYAAGVDAVRPRTRGVAGPAQAVPEVEAWVQERAGGGGG